MKVSEFVKALQEMPQDAEITFTVGFDDEEREGYALAVLDPDLPDHIKSCLEGLIPEKIKAESYITDEESLVEVTIDADLTFEELGTLDRYHQYYIEKRDGDQPKEA